ncbi:MAG: DUF2950 domain-containing protein [Planctomycetes bacterium]|nr:DUF2950 domain-containing protein [Planctomycetota bacterium]
MKLSHGSDRGMMKYCLMLAATALTGLVGCAQTHKEPQAQTVETKQPQASKPAQRTFATASDAVTAMFGAMERKDDQGLEALFGPDAGELMHSGDPVDDQRQRQVLVAAKNEKWSLQDKGPDQKELIIGNENWPFPVPLVLERGSWRFDTVAGTTEVQARRIGRNELAVIGLCREYLKAQNDYAAESHDGASPGAYAQRLKSQPGKHDGLYWPAEPGQRLSPLGGVAARATAEGYSVQESGPAPYHGYWFRILSAQGPAAPGGARDYIQNGLMTGGFALVAYPAEYGNSGIMTFMISKDGTLLESDLGEKTSEIAAAIKAFNPDSRWKPTK